MVMTHGGFDDANSSSLQGSPARYSLKLQCIGTNFEQAVVDDDSGKVDQNNFEKNREIISTYLSVMSSFWRRARRSLELYVKINNIAINAINVGHRSCH